jgi:phenylpropionate dioxygenase-like ring-hydroxylating dioxygenase large terminal subunit
MIPKFHYFSEEVLGRELNRMFDADFQFVALTTELAHDRDFVCLDYPGRAIVVQNFKQQLRAFENVCTHRFNRIQCQDRGNRPLTCSYHGWTFDQAGAPVGLPKREQFLDSSGALPPTLSLPQFPLATCGKFVFVDTSGKGLSLRTYLGRFYDVLEEISRYIGNEVHYGTIEHQANWKLLVENVLECYHCAVVHPDTFLSGLGVGRLPIADVFVDQGHSSAHFPRVEVKREQQRRKVLSHLDGRQFTHNSFFHIHILPNLFISSTEGTSFYVGHALPLSAEVTLLRTRFYEAAVEFTAAQRNRQDAINSQSRVLGTQVIEEDRAILEQVQRGIRLSSRPGHLGLEELRIKAFHDSYAEAMGLETAAA